VFVRISLPIPTTTTTVVHIISIMPLTTLSNQIRCSLEQMCCESSGEQHTTCIPLYTFLSAGLSLAAAVGSALQKSVSLSIGHALHLPAAQPHLLIDEYMTPTASLNQEPAHSPSQSEIVSITGALIVCTVLIACVLLTHLFDALDDLMRRCRPLIAHPGQCVRQWHHSLSTELRSTHDDDSNSSDATKLASLGAPWTPGRVVAWLTGRLRKRINWSLSFWSLNQTSSTIIITSFSLSF
jgi:hypothetical protein